MKNYKLTEVTNDYASEYVYLAVGDNGFRLVAAVGYTPDSAKDELSSKRAMQLSGIAIFKIEKGS